MELQQFSIKIQRTGSAVQVLQKGEGPNLVFLHGAGGLAGWGQDLELLSRSFKVTVPLFPGFGQSTGIEGIDDVLDAVLHNFDVLKELRIYRPHLVGHSMG
ncbi:alpha/beta fold hydrolase, partial [Candidatus Sumerlaeota bacterium]|nr:alpha/beta fold hydrolase [Candidatus Sumerlaeota bacterium]